MFIRQEFRLYPNKHQKSRLSGWIGCARKVWNIMLAKNIEQYETNKKFIFAYDMNSMLPIIKKDTETSMPSGEPAGASCVQKSDDSRFCNSHCLSHFAAFFIVVGT